MLLVILAINAAILAGGIWVVVATLRWLEVL
jgi:hypothetical protein